MKACLVGFTVFKTETMLNALKKIDANREGFVIVVDHDDKVLGVLTDGDIRRAFIKGCKVDEMIDSYYSSKAKTVYVDDSLEIVCEIFKNQSIKFLPIVDHNNCLVNVITKYQLQALMLRDINADLTYDFLSINTGIIDYEIFQKPWGFYKTTVLNDYYQGKIISVRPGEQLSLQSHAHREEHWIVVHGTGIVQLDDSHLTVSCGSNVFIPKGCKHRLTNTEREENLIITEVQIGDYLGEDDIIRYEDNYGRQQGAK